MKASVCFFLKDGVMVLDGVHLGTRLPVSESGRGTSYFESVPNLERYVPREDLVRSTKFFSIRVYYENGTCPFAPGVYFTEGGTFVMVQSAGPVTFAEFDAHSWDYALEVLGHVKNGDITSPSTTETELARITRELSEFKKYLAGVSEERDRERFARERSNREAADLRKQIAAAMVEMGKQWDELQAERSANQRLLRDIKAYHTFIVAQILKTEHLSPEDESFIRGNMDGLLSRMAALCKRAKENAERIAMLERRSRLYRFLCFICVF